MLFHDVPMINMFCKQEKQIHHKNLITLRAMSIGRKYNRLLLSKHISDDIQTLVLISRLRLVNFKFSNKFSLSVIS